MGDKPAAAPTYASRLERAVERACHVAGEFADSMPGASAAGPQLMEKLRRLPQGTAQQLAVVTLAGVEGLDERRELIGVYQVVAHLLDSPPPTRAAVISQLQPLPVSEVKFRIAERLFRFISPTDFNLVAPDHAAADPLLAGSNVGACGRPVAGSITCFVTDDGGADLLLTCHHVLRGEPRGARQAIDMDFPAGYAEQFPNQPMFMERAKRGEDEIFQPAAQYGGTPIGTYARGISTNEIDAAVAHVQQRKFFNRTREGIAIAGVATVKVNDPVWKRGSGNRVQRGFVRAIGTFTDDRSGMQYLQHIAAVFPAPPGFGMTHALGPMHDEDDDGCPMLDARNYLVGIVVGRTNRHGSAIATPIRRVFDGLNVRLPTQGAA